MADFGIGDELRLVFADRNGCWAYLDLYTYGQRRYTEEDLSFAGAVVSVLTVALRQAPTPDVAAFPSGAVRDPAVLVLDPDLSLVAQTGPAAEWLPLLRRAPGDPLPCAVLAATARALADRSDRPAAVRQRAADGQWATVRAARLDTGGIAVTIDHSRAGEVLNYVARVAALTRRERQLLALLYEGYDTRSIAARLVIAETTVQDHVKSILIKTGHSSRRTLLAALAPPAPPGE
jgi:DNA-binding CsgD family transcriptional regulator